MQDKEIRKDFFIWKKEKLRIKSEGETVLCVCAPFFLNI